MGIMRYIYQQARNGIGISYILLYKVIIHEIIKTYAISQCRKQSDYKKGALQFQTII